MAHFTGATERRIAWFVAVSALAACGGGTETNTSGDGGSTTSTSTETGGGGTGATAGSGGTGGTGAIAGGGTGGTGGTAGAGGSGMFECFPVCEQFGGTCANNGDCVFAEKTLYVRAEEIHWVDSAGQPMDFAKAEARLAPAGTVMSPSAILATAGPCNAVAVSSDGPPPPPNDAGTVTVEGPSFPTTLLTPGAYSKVMMMAADVFAPGDLIQFDVTGGPDFPAFAAQVAAPDELELIVPSIQQSQPVTVSWNPPEPPALVLLHAGAGEAIYCKPVSPGSLEIPVSLLSLLDPPEPGQMTNGRVTAWRLNSVPVDVGSPGAQARVVTIDVAEIYLPYNP